MNIRFNRSQLETFKNINKTRAFNKKATETLKKVVSSSYSPESQNELISVLLQDYPKLSSIKTTKNRKLFDKIFSLFIHRERSYNPNASRENLGPALNLFR